MDVVELCVTSSELNFIVSAMTILLQVSRSCRVRTFPWLRVLSVRTAIRRTVTKDLSHQRPQCSSGGRGKTDASLARRPDCHIDRCVEELGDIVEAANEGEPDNCRSGAAVAELVFNEGLRLRSDLQRAECEDNTDANLLPSTHLQLVHDKDRDNAKGPIRQAG